MKVKNILFRLKLKGNGIVNYDSPDQRFMYNGTDLKNMKTQYENTSYAKKRFYTVDDKMEYKIAISSNCLRHEIFKDDMPIQSPNVVNGDHLLYSFIASPAAIIRGYLFAGAKPDTLKRSGALTITAAEQTCNAVSYIDTLTRSGKKIEGGDDSDTSFFRKETIGNIEYEAIGNIDLMTLQFISCDKVFDRFSFNPDMFNIYKQFLKLKFPTFDSELGYYQIVGSSIEIPELGIKLTNDNVVALTKELFANLLNVNIRRSGAYAATSELEYKFVYDTIEDTYDSEDGWVTLTNRKDVDNVDFECEDFYLLEDITEAKNKRAEIEADFQHNKTEKAAIKVEKKSAADKVKADKITKKSKTNE